MPDEAPRSADAESARADERAAQMSFADAFTAEITALQHSLETVAGDASSGNTAVPTPVPDGAAGDAAIYVAAAQLAVLQRRFNEHVDTLPSHDIARLAARLEAVRKQLDIARLWQVQAQPSTDQEQGDSAPSRADQSKSLGASAVGKKKFAFKSRKPTAAAAAAATVAKAGTASTDRVEQPNTTNARAAEVEPASASEEQAWPADAIVIAGRTDETVDLADFVDGATSRQTVVLTDLDSCSISLSGAAGRTTVFGAVFITRVRSSIVRGITTDGSFLVNDCIDSKLLSCTARQFRLHTSRRLIVTYDFYAADEGRGDTAVVVAPELHVKRPVIEKCADMAFRNMCSQGEAAQGVDDFSDPARVSTNYRILTSAEARELDSR